MATLLQQCSGGPLGVARGPEFAAFEAIKSAIRGKEAVSPLVPSTGTLTKSRFCPASAPSSRARKSKPNGAAGGFDVFAEQVVPILRKRGLFRKEYAGQTLRDHYGLTRPASIYSSAIQAIA
jgi:hypothetical protein